MPRVDCYQTFCGAVIYAEGGQLGEKLEFIFKLFDFDGDNSVNYDELNILLLSCIRGMGKLAGILTSSSQNIRHTKGINLLVATIFEEMDRDHDKRIDCEEFKLWCQNNKEVREYIQKYTNMSDIFAALALHKQQLQTIQDAFLAICDDDKHVETNKCLALFADTGCVRVALNNREYKLCHELLNHNGVVHYAEFKALASALLSYDVVDKDSNRKLDQSEVRSLLWLRSNKEPSETRLLYEINRMGSKEVITRYDWLAKQAVMVDDQSSKRKYMFDMGVQKIYEGSDCSGDGKLAKDEIIPLIHKILLETIGEAHITKTGKDMLKSMADGLTAELLEKVDMNDDGFVAWEEFREHLDLVWEKEREISRWFHDFQTNNYARAFSFDRTGKASLSKDDLISLLLHSLKHPITYRLITSYDAQQLATKTANKMIDMIDLDGNGCIARDSIHKHLTTFLNLENAMLNELNSKKEKSKKMNRFANKSKANDFTHRRHANHGYSHTTSHLHRRQSDSARRGHDRKEHVTKYGVLRSPGSTNRSLRKK